MNNYLIVVIGPTAIGKTALAIKLAQYFNCHIVSCDSRQFFKEMSIGTAVPSAQELSEAQHHFIQNKSIFSPYTVGDYQKEALHLLNDLFTNQNNIQILVGGSGLYVDTVVKGLDDFPTVNERTKQLIDINFEKHGIDYLQQTLKEKDPKYYFFLKENNPQTLLNPQRMKRYVAVCCTDENKPYSSYINQNKINRNFTPIFIGLNASRELMYDRINQRVDIMINNGLLKEAEKLYQYKDLNALQTVGYRELFAFFDGEYSLDFAIEEIKKNTRRFAKRQITWFKRYEETQWFDINDSLSKITNYLHKVIV